MMDIQVIDNQPTALMSKEESKEVALQWLTSTGNLQKFNEQEKSQFIDMCCAFGLNPIKREIYGIKYKGKDGKPDTFNIIIGYEVYLKRAERTGKLNGFNTTIRKVGDDTVATCTIYRKDWEHPFVHEVFLSEYHQHNKMWNEKPITMIKKVAEEQAFRKCFPDEMGGLPYGAEELPIEEETTRPSANENGVQSSYKSSETKSKNNSKKIAPAKAYTTEQAEELGNIVNSVYGDNSPIFTTEEKDLFREQLLNGEFDAAKEKAVAMMQERIEAVSNL